MILRLNGRTRIEDLRHRYGDVIEELRGLLAAGAKAYPGAHRKNFYDIENGSRWFYIHITPTGTVWLLASWLKEQDHGECPVKLERDMPGSRVENLRSTFECANQT